MQEELVSGSGERAQCRSVLAASAWYLNLNPCKACPDLSFDLPDMCVPAIIAAAFKRLRADFILFREKLRLQGKQLGKCVHQCSSLHP